MSDLSPEAIIAEVIEGGYTTGDYPAGIAAHVVSRLRDAGHTIVPRDDLFADQADEIAVLKQDLADAQAAITAVRSLVKSEPGGPGYKWECVHAFEIIDALAAAASPTAQEET